MISLIACVGKNLEIGKDNDLVFHIKEDLKYFKKVTLNKIVVMGYNTYLSLPNLLPNRTNIILTRKKIKIEGAIIYNNFEKLLKDMLKKNEEVFIIGGASLYEEFIDYADRLYLTEVDAERNAKVDFPKFNKELYNKKIISQQIDNNLKYDFVLYEKK